MTLPNDTCRCVGRKALTHNAKVCPRRDRCAWYTDIPEDCTHVPVSMWLCDGFDLFLDNAELRRVAAGEQKHE